MWFTLYALRKKSRKLHFFEVGGGLNHCLKDYQFDRPESSIPRSVESKSNVIVASLQVVQQEKPFSCFKHIFSIHFLIGIKIGRAIDQFRIFRNRAAQWGSAYWVAYS